jgi:hypothetical protein
MSKKEEILRKLSELENNVNSTIDEIKSLKKSLEDLKLTSLKTETENPVSKKILLNE